MRFRGTFVGLCVTAGVVVAWMFVPSFLRTEASAKDVAQQMLREEFVRLGVREDGFTFVDLKRSGFDWIVTWQSKSAPSAQVGVTITPFEADVWGRPIVPSCKDDRLRTVAYFGEIC